MAVYDAVRELELALDGFRTERRELSVSSEFTRVTTTVVLEGAGEVGQGEDITYQADLHDGFPELRERGRMTLAELSNRLESYGLDDYRRWAFESAALDLGLRQNGLSLGDALGRTYRPVRFVVSTRGDAFAWLDQDPSLEFKLDPEPKWSREFMERLAATGRVRVLDLKGYYRGTPVDLAPDPNLYRSVVETFPDVVIEDAWLEEEFREVLRGAEARLSFDAPVHSLADLRSLPLEPRWLNVKPSRFGTVERLFECMEYCEGRGIAMYGGGQFELGVGRAQIQALASLFYPQAPNDVAPGVYNEGGPRPGLPQSPLPAPNGPGF
jgi:L-alanine-DL-glutamate epimerase-like enolase superfamily enzyme